MNKLLTVVVGLIGLLFILMGLRWLVDPAAMAAELGMPLLDGLGLSTQIGDLGAFFFVGGSLTIIGLLTRKHQWFLAPAFLVGTTALFRLIAWLAHDAKFATQQIIVEIVVCCLLLLASKHLAVASKD
jgi:hypothetical protein